MKVASLACMCISASCVDLSECLSSCFCCFNRAQEGLISDAANLTEQCEQSPKAPEVLQVELEFIQRQLTQTKKLSEKLLLQPEEITVHAIVELGKLVYKLLENKDELLKKYKLPPELIDEIELIIKYFNDIQSKAREQRKNLKTRY